MKNIRYAIEAFFLALMAGIFWIMPLDAASAVGGFMGRAVGPRLASSRKALANIELAFPQKTPSERLLILADMYENLGRVMAEYPHLRRIVRERVELVNHDLFESTKNNGKPALIIGAHLGNWELFPTFMGYIHPGFHCIYREPNNPWSAFFLHFMRRRAGDVRLIPKSFAGTREMVQVMKKNGHVGILIDQKYNEGLPIPFFGHPAMTSSAFAQMAQKFQAPVLTLRTERIKGAHFRATFHPGPAVDQRPVEDILNEAHRQLEGWITEKPGQWLWLHRRWPKNS